MEVASHGLKPSHGSTAGNVPSLASEFAYLAKREQSRQAKKRLELIKARALIACCLSVDVAEFLHPDCDT
jgi:hypothetical protein